MAAARADWSHELRAGLLAFIKDQVLRGKTSDTGLKSEAWEAIRVAFNAKYDRAMTKGQLQSQFTKMKADYKTFLPMMDLSGFGWNEHLQTLVAEASVWDAYIAAHPAAKKFRNKPFPLFLELKEICTGIVATGEFAITGDEPSLRNAPRSSSTAVTDDEPAPASQEAGNTESSDESAEPTQSTQQQAPRQDTDSFLRPPERSPFLRPPAKRSYSELKNPKMAMAKAVLALAESTSRGAAVQKAIATFNVRYAAKYSIRQRLDFSTFLGENPAFVDVFNALDREVQELMVKDKLDNVDINV